MADEIVHNPFAESVVVRRSKRKEAVARVVFSAMAFSMIAPLLAVLAYLVYKAWPALTWEFLTEHPRDEMTAGGIWPVILGTVYLVVFSLGFTAPVGILAGIYLNEFARDNWFTRFVNLAVINLAGVPSIVHALFGVGAFVVALGLGKSVLAASLTLGVMTLPVIITATREALASVPMSFREACWNMGASRWQTIRTIVLPNSVSGMLTGVILEVCRAAGETAPILFTGMVFYKSLEGRGLFAYGPFDQFMALSSHLHMISTQAQGIPESVQYATAVVLIGFILVFNSAAILIRIRLRSRKKW